MSYAHDEWSNRLAAIMVFGLIAVAIVMRVFT